MDKSWALGIVIFLVHLRAMDSEGFIYGSCHSKRAPDFQCFLK